MVREGKHPENVKYFENREVSGGGTREDSLN